MKKKILFLLSTILIIIGVSIHYYNNKNANETGIGGTEKAKQLVTGYANHVGAGGRALDANNDISFGSTGLHYDSAKDVLTGRVYITKAWIHDASPKGLANYRKMVGFLNNPKIGGMFDHAGGTFVLDEDSEAYFLTKDFLIASTSQTALNAQMDSMYSLSGIWVTKWFKQVADIMNGFEPAPTSPITKENNTQ